MSAGRLFYSGGYRGADRGQCPPPPPKSPRPNFAVAKVPRLENAILKIPSF